MWMLKTDDDAEAPFTFRILPGNIKTIGRATRAGIDAIHEHAFDHVGKRAAENGRHRHDDQAGQHYENAKCQHG